MTAPVALKSASRFSVEDYVLQCAVQMAVKCPFLKYRTDFCRHGKDFRDCRWAPAQVWFFSEISVCELIAAVTSAELNACQDLIHF